MHFEASVEILGKLATLGRSSDSAEDDATVRRIRTEHPGAICEGAFVKFHSDRLRAERKASRHLEIEPRETLAEVLRGRCRLTGVKVILREPRCAAAARFWWMGCR